MFLQDIKAEILMIPYQLGLYKICYSGVQGFVSSHILEQLAGYAQALLFFQSGESTASCGHNGTVGPVLDTYRLYVCMQLS